MIVLKIIGFVLLGILALVIIALSIKVRVFIEYSEVDTNVKLQWLFLKIPVYPSDKDSSAKKTKKNKKEKNAADNTETAVTEAVDTASADVNSEASEADAAEVSAETSETATSAATPKQKNNLLKTLYDAHGIDGLMLLVHRVFSYIGTFLGDLMHALVIDELYVDVMCTRNDAASTAIYYGEVCTGLFPMLGALVTNYKVRKYDINVYPDFLAKTSSASFAVSLHLYPIYVVGITLALVFKMLFKVILRLIVKCFLPSKQKVAENNNKTGSSEPAAK